LPGLLTILPNTSGQTEIHPGFNYDSLQGNPNTIENPFYLSLLDKVML